MIKLTKSRIDPEKKESVEIHLNHEYIISVRPTFDEKGSYISMADGSFIIVKESVETVLAMMKAKKLEGKLYERL